MCMGTSCANLTAAISLTMREIRHVFSSLFAAMWALPAGGQQIGCFVLCEEPSSPESPRSSEGQNSEPPDR